MQTYYTQYYSLQEGAGVAGSNNDDHFQPIKLPRVYQRGNGIGGIFSSIWRFLRPIFKSGANILKNELTETGIDVLKGINDQKPMNEILRDRTIKVVDNLRDASVSKIKKMTGSGIKRKRVQHKSINRNSKKVKRQLEASNRIVNNKHKKRSKKTSSKVIAHKKLTSKLKPRVLDIFS